MIFENAESSTKIPFTDVMAKAPFLIIFQTSTTPLPRKAHQRVIGIFVQKHAGKVNQKQHA
jgi:hypothetical protein